MQTKNSFHEKLQALNNAQADNKQQVSQVDLDVVDAAARGAAEREAQWPKWPTLQKMLPGLRGLQDEAQTLEEALAAKEEEMVADKGGHREELEQLRAAKEEELAAKDKTLATKEEELAAAVADKERHREELQQLRAQLSRLEGVPP